MKYAAIAPLLILTGCLHAQTAGYHQIDLNPLSSSPGLIVSPTASGWQSCFGSPTSYTCNISFVGSSPGGLLFTNEGYLQFGHSTTWDWQMYSTGANELDWQDSTNVIRMKLNVGATGGGTLLTAPSVLTGATTDADTVFTLFGHSSTQSADLMAVGKYPGGPLYMTMDNVGNTTFGSGAIVAVTADGSLVVNAASGSTVPVTVNGVTGNNADLLDVNDNSPATVFSVAKTVATLYADQLATSGSGNISANPFDWRSYFWNGSASTNDDWRAGPALGTGTSPATTFEIGHYGGSAGTASIDLENDTTITGNLTITGTCLSGCGGGLPQYVVDGATLSGSTWTATGTNAVIESAAASGAAFEFFYNGSLTSGNPFTPTSFFNIHNAAGHAQLSDTASNQSLTISSGSTFSNVLTSVDYLASSSPTIAGTTTGGRTACTSVSAYTGASDASGFASYTIPTVGVCAIQITFGQTAPHYWSCQGSSSDSTGGVLEVFNVYGSPSSTSVTMLSPDVISPSPYTGVFGYNCGMF